MTIIRATFAPKIRPTLARINSAAAGFFFCGMMDEPVENRSERVTKRNCAEDQITNSSAKRDKCIAQIDATDRNSNAKSRSLTASKEFDVGRANPNSAA